MFCVFLERTKVFLFFCFEGRKSNYFRLFLYVFSVFFLCWNSYQIWKKWWETDKVSKKNFQFEKVNDFFVILMIKMFNLNKNSCQYIGTNLVNYTGQKNDDFFLFLGGGGGQQNKSSNNWRRGFFIFVFLLNKTFINPREAFTHKRDSLFLWIRKFFLLLGGVE